MSAGTKSKVFFRVNGDMAETGVRKMDDGFREVCDCFTPGSGAKYCYQLVCLSVCLSVRGIILIDCLWSIHASVCGRHYTLCGRLIQSDHSDMLIHVSFCISSLCVSR